jgi:hypothetical protein
MTRSRSSRASVSVASYGTMTTARERAHEHLVVVLSNPMQAGYQIDFVTILPVSRAPHLMVLWESLHRTLYHMHMQ